MNTAPIFDRLAYRYNFFNHLFSFGIDVIWRKKAVKHLFKMLAEADYASCKILDAACGTGDITLLLAKKGCKVDGIDISEQMLKIAQERCKEFDDVKLWLQDASKSNPEMNGYDAITIGYGIRNFDNRKEALLQFHRELKEGGVLMILEFATLRNKFLRVFYDFYFKRIMPFLSYIFSGGKLKGEFRYFVNSVEKFPKYSDFCREIAEAGFCDVNYKRESGGISVMYTAIKR